LIRAQKTLMSRESPLVASTFLFPLWKSQGRPVRVARPRVAAALDDDAAAGLGALFKVAGHQNLSWLFYSSAFTASEELYETQFRHRNAYRANGHCHIEQCRVVL
jgi:hypothetical protein